MSLSSTVKGPSSLSSRQRCCLAMHASHFRCDVGHSACSTISAPDIGHPLLLTAAFTEVSHVHWALPFRHRLRQPQCTSAGGPFWRKHHRQAAQSLVCCCCLLASVADVMGPPSPSGLAWCLLASVAEAPVTAPRLLCKLPATFCSCRIQQHHPSPRAGNLHFVQQVNSNGLVNVLGLNRLDDIVDVPIADLKDAQQVGTCPLCWLSNLSRNCVLKFGECLWGRQLSMRFTAACSKALHSWGLYQPPAASTAH